MKGEKKRTKLVVVGSLGFDHVMSLPGVFSDWILPDKIHQLNVSFTVKDLKRYYGGTGGNCAYSLGLLGSCPILVGCLGKEGRDYLKHLTQARVNLDNVTLDERTFSASGHVMTDRSDNQIWSYYPGPLVKMKRVEMKNIVSDDSLVVLMPSEPKAFIKHLKELVALKVRFMFDPAFFIPNLNRGELKLGIGKAEIVVGNDYEIAMMEKKSKSQMRDWLTNDRIVIRTLGANGSEIFQNKNRWKIKPAKPVKVVDPTGAGDAYRAGFLAGYVRGLPLKQCGQMGSVAAAYAVEKYGTQTYRFTVAEFEARYQENYGG